MLTKLEVLNITETIDKAEISFSHLRDELIDHVCCEIEHQMKNGFNFKDAFEYIKPQVGIRELQKVQEGTLLLIDKKYRIMKRLMKISGVVSLVGLIVGSLARVYHLPAANFIMAFGFLILCVLFLPSSISIMRKENKANSKILLYLSAYIGSIGFSLGIFFKVMHWPFAGIIITVGIVFLSIVFLPALWFSLKKTITSKIEKIAVLIGIMGGSLHFIAVLFKMNHWPGASIIFMLSVIILIFVFLPVYSYIKFKSETHVNEKFIYIIYAFTFFVLLTMLLQFQFAFDISKVLEKDAASKAVIINYEDSQSDKSFVSSKDSLYQTRLKGVLIELTEINFILDSVNHEFFSIMAPDIPFNKDNEPFLRNHLKNNGNSGIFESIMIDSGENSPATRIKNKFTKILLDLKQIGIPNDKYSILSALLDITNSKNSSNSSWEESAFRNKKPIVQYLVLLSLQERVKLAESELLCGY